MLTILLYLFISTQMIPVRLTLHNRLLQNAVELYVTAENNHTFDLVGLDMLRLTLDANQATTIPIQALISQPGVHDLQAFSLTIRQTDKTEVSFSLDKQWLVTVTDSSAGPLQ